MVPGQIVWMAAALALATGEQAPPTFRADVTQVVVDVGVIDGNDQVVRGLGKGDFRVFDEGREQVIVALASEERPLDLILLFDISGSMRPKIEQVAAVASQALGELRRGDRVSVMVFNTESWQPQYFTPDLNAVERAIQGVLRLSFEGGTFIHQAVYHAANEFLWAEPSHNRRAILIVTDNRGIRTRNEMSVVRRLWEADAVLSGLVIPDRGSLGRAIIVGTLAPFALLRQGGMSNIAAKTGGETIHSDNLATAFPEMMRRIRSRYSLYYRAPEAKAGSFRNIRVELAAEAQKRLAGARLYARRGYRVATPHRN
jgi:VWFA-related protein